MDQFPGKISPLLLFPSSNEQISLNDEVGKNSAEIGATYLISKTKSGERIKVKLEGSHRRLRNSVSPGHCGSLDENMQTVVEH